MPRSLMHTVRGYKTGKYFESAEYDPYVMTTRSGLSIRTIPVSIKEGSFTRLPVLGVKESSKDNCPKKKKRHSIVKYRSLSYMSFVTRFYLCLRVPELDLAGVNPRETLQYIENFSSDSGDDTDRSNDSDDDDDEESETSTPNRSLIDNYNQREGFFANTNAEEFNPTETKHEEGKDATETTENEESQATLSVCSESQSDIMFDQESLFSSAESVGSDDVFPDSYESGDGPAMCRSSSESFVDVENSPCSFGRSDSESDSMSSKSSRDDDRLKRLQVQVDLVNVSNGKKLIQCQHCDKVFALMSAFSSHLKTHMKVKNCCQVCGKVFSRSWLLKGHLRTHTGERPFPCPHSDCDKAFADKSNLRSHLLIHTVTSKNFSCKKCGRAFAQKRYLHKHMLEVCRLI